MDEGRLVILWKGNSGKGTERAERDSQTGFLRVFAAFGR